MTQHAVKLENFGNGKTLMMFQAEGLMFLDDAGGNALIADQMGCISGNAMISVHRAGRSFKIRLDQLHMKFNHLGGNWKPETEIPTMARSLMPNGTFRLNKVLDVIYKGEKDTLLIKTQSGKELKLTPDHKVRTPVGWVEARTLKIGSKILVIPKEDVITSIEPGGIQQVFDIVMDEPAHNFIANGIVVHNCGKTVEALAYLALHPEMRPAVVVCPASLKLNWQREAEAWLDKSTQITTFWEDKNGEFVPEKKWIEVINGGKVHELNSDIVIINYDILKKWLPELKRIQPEVVIYDESHYIKSPKSSRSKAAKELASIVPHKILLTGTPVLNRPSELWNQLGIIRPDEYSPKRFFNWHLRYTAAHKIHIGRDKTAWDFSGASNLDELALSLKSIMIRRTKEQVLPELPAKRRSTVLIPIDNRKEYDRADKEFMAWMTEQKGEAAAERASHVEQLAKREYLKQVAIKGKMIAAIEWIKTFLESGEKLIIFGTHRATIHALEREFGNTAVSVIGGMNAEAKDAAVNAFQNDPNIRLFVGNIQAAGVGLTLTAASNVAFLELADGPEMLKQCEDRAHRIGQDNAVNCWYLLAENTIDGKIVDLVESKREVIDQITEEERGLGFDLFDLMKEDE